jgi:hypothetical protein
MYICPVCGYERMPDPPVNFNICPCCGTEFELDDLDTTYAALRQRWIAAGCPWFDALEEKPAGWNPNRQLINLLYTSSARNHLPRVPEVSQSTSLLRSLQQTGNAVLVPEGSWVN